MKTERANIKAVERQIDAEAKRMATHTTERRERAREKSEKAKKAMEDAEAQLKALEDQGKEKVEALNNIRPEGGPLQASRDRARSRIQECESQIKMIKDSEKNALAPYGTGIEAVIKEVQTMRWHGQQPLGPLGRFVKLKDQKWADVLRANLSGAMFSWAVTDARDRAPLKTLLERYGKYVVCAVRRSFRLTRSGLSRNVNIIISAVDVFDYSRGEAPQEFLTPLRVLEVKFLRIATDLSNLSPTLLVLERMGNPSLHQSTVD